MANSGSTWLIKSEPAVYSWSQLVADGQTRWDGVRSFEGRNNLRAMGLGDRCLFYHSNEGKEIVGVAQVIRAAYPDPNDEEWTAVDVAPLVPLANPVSLAAIRVESSLADMALLRRSRLSVSPVRPGELALILKMAKTRLPNAAAK